jgi:hypothetical protein
MKPRDAAPREPDIFKKSTNLGISIAAKVTISIIKTSSV